MSAPERRDPQDAVFAPEELLRALPTPCYVYDEAQLRTRAARLRRAVFWAKSRFTSSAWAWTFCFIFNITFVVILLYPILLCFSILIFNKFESFY